MSVPGLLTRRRNSRVRAAGFPGKAVHNELATAVLLLQGSGHAPPTERQRFVAHHASVLLGLLRARARFKAKLNAGDDEDGDDEDAEPAPRLPSEACFPALLEGARAMYATLDAITRVSHTKRYTIQQNRQKCHDAMALLARANKDFRRREKRGALGPMPGSLMRGIAGKATVQHMAFSATPTPPTGSYPGKEVEVTDLLLAHMELTSRLDKTDDTSTHISEVTEDLYASKLNDQLAQNSQVSLVVKRRNGTYWQLIKAER